MPNHPLIKLNVLVRMPHCPGLLDLCFYVYCYSIFVSNLRFEVVFIGDIKLAASVDNQLEDVRAVVEIVDVSFLVGIKVSDEAVDGKGVSVKVVSFSVAVRTGKTKILGVKYRII